MKMGTHTFSGYVFTVKRSRKRQWFHFPLCSLRSRVRNPVSCLWIIHFVGQANWWSPSGPNLQNNPPQEASSYREASVPGSTDLGLLVEGLSSQERHSRQGVVGGRKQAQGWQVCRVSHPFDVEWLFQTQQRWASVSFLWLPWQLRQQFLHVGNWVTGQEGFRVAGEEIVSLYCNYKFC